MIEVGIALLIGIVLVGIGYFGYAGKFKGIAMVLGGIMVLAALFYPGYGYYGDAFTQEEPVATIAGASFDVTPINGSWATAGQACTVTVADDEESATAQLVVATASDELHTNYTSVNFTLDPVAPAGVTNEDLITVHFSVDQKIKYAGEYVFDETSNDWEADWRINGESTDDDGVGSHTMLYTDSDWVELRLQFSSGADSFGAEMQTVGETFTIPVTFSCGSWHQTFDIDVIVIELV